MSVYSGNNPLWLYVSIAQPISINGLLHNSHTNPGAHFYLLNMHITFHMATAVLIADICVT